MNKKLKILSITSLFISLLLISCITDGPNKTGGAFLDDNGFVVDRKLDSIKVKDFEVDTFWMDLQDQNKVGSNHWVLGKQKKFYSEGKIGYLLDSLADVKGGSLDSSKLHLYLNFSDSIWKSKFDDFNSTDSIKILVRSIHFTVDTNSSGDESDHVIDTSEIDLAAADFFEWKVSDSSFVSKYGGKLMEDTIQIGDPSNWSELENGYFLPSLSSEIGQHPKFLQQVFFRFSLLDSSIETGLLRFNIDTLRFAYDYTNNSDSAVSGNKNILKYSYNSRLMVSHQISHPDMLNSEASTFLFGQAKGLRYRINRENLLKKVNDLGYPFDKKEGLFSNQYFVPFSKIRLPVSNGDSSYVERNFAMDFEAQSRVDSNSSENNSNVFLLKVGDTIQQTIINTKTLEKIDDVDVSYVKDSGEYFIYIEHTKDSLLNDSIKIKNFDFIKGIHAGGALTYNALPDTSHLRIEFLNSVIGFVENKIVPRFDPSNDNGISFDVSRGMQNLFNRTNNSGGLLYEFAAIPKINGGYNIKDQKNITFPIFGELPLNLTNEGKLLIDIDLYLVRIDNR